MTIEEAIKHCEEVAEVNHKMVESLVGIDTDEQERCRECAKDHEQLAEWLKELKVYKENTSGDAISRQAVAEILLKYAHSTEGKAFAEFLISQINELPFVTPQQKTGQWVWDSKSKVYRCSCCKRFPWRVEYVTDHDEIFEDLTRTNAYKYCPNCKTKMEVKA